MKKVIVISVLLLFFVLGYSQIHDSTSVFRTGSYTLSYVGNNLVKPGLKFGTNIILSEKTLVKTKKRKSSKTITNAFTRQLMLAGNIGFFWHPKSHIGAFNYYELTYRKINLKNGKYSKIGFGPGLYRSFYPETYQVDDNGDIAKIPFAGRIYLSPVLTFGSGKFVKDSFFKYRTFTTTLLFLFDYNSGVVPLLNFEIGLGFDFSKNKTK